MAEKTELERQETSGPKNTKDSRYKKFEYADNNTGIVYAADAVLSPPPNSKGSRSNKKNP